MPLFCHVLTDRERGDKMVDSYSHGIPKQWVPKSQADILCAECGESVWPARPIYCWHDNAVRCHQCQRLIERGDIPSAVPGSTITEWYATERAINQAQGKINRARAAGDMATVQRMQMVLMNCWDMRRTIIRRQVERASNGSDNTAA